jgi:hypothetical protein
MAIKPTKPTVPPAPSRSNPGVDFSNKADVFAAFQAPFADYMDEVADFVDEMADDALAAALGGDLPPLTGQGGKVLAVKGDESGAEFINAGQVAAGSATAPAVYPASDTNTGIFFPAADTIAFTEGGVESMRINASGNVGIGTNDPQQLLHLSGGVPDIRYTDTTGAEWRAGNNNGVFRFVNQTTGEEHFRIAADGQIGFGGANYGTAGQVATSNGPGAAPSWTVAGTPILTWVKQASTSGSAIDFTGIPNTVREIVIIYDFVSLSASADFLIQIGPSGGVETTGYNSRSVGVAAASAASTSSGSGYCMVSFSAAGATTAQVNLWRIGTTNEWQMSASGMRDPTVSLNASGSKTLASALTQVRCTRTGSVTYVGGSILLGYR